MKEKYKPKTFKDKVKTYKLKDKEGGIYSQYAKEIEIAKGFKKEEDFEEIK